jgi:hypothetical protein
LRGEGLAGEVKQWEGPLARAGLDRAELEFAADALDLLADVDDPGVEVDVVPATVSRHATISLHACRLGARHSSDEGCPRS